VSEHEASRGQGRGRGHSGLVCLGHDRSRGRGRGSGGGGDTNGGHWERHSGSHDTGEEEEEGGEVTHVDEMYDGVAEWLSGLVVGV
jgi:hypothetical protein